MISIIVVGYKSQQLLKYFFKSFEKVNVSAPHEFIVVDNASHDGTKEMIEKFHPQVTYIENTHNLGYAKACNIGMRAASGDYFLFLNPDIIVLPGSIEALQKYLEEHLDVAVVAPKLTKPSGLLQATCRRWPPFATPFYRLRRLASFKPIARRIADYLMEDYDHERPREVDWVIGGATMVRRSATTEVGMWDEQFFMYFEDADWCRRFWDKNYKVVYLATTSMFHYYGQESTESPSIRSIISSRTTRAHISSWLKYMRKYFRKDIPLASPSARHL